MGKLNYLTKEGFRNLVVNKLMTLASVTVLFSCLMLVGIAFMLQVNINNFINSIEAENEIVAFVEYDAEDFEIKKVKTDLEKIKNVEKVEFVSGEDAFQEVIDNTADEGLKTYLGNLEDDVMPHAYHITVADMSAFEDVVKQVGKVQGVFRVRENSELAQKLTDLRSGITYISLGMIILLLAVSLFIISNTVRITMFSRRLEISIMKSVGATNSFIRWPFIVEGIVIGVIAGLLATGVVWIVNDFGLNKFIGKIATTAAGGGDPVMFLKYAPWLALAFVGIGVFTGVFGSMTSMRKYLKERKFVELED